MADVLLPILKNNKDPHYRYKMPKLCAKIEGSGNGIKTVITNMSAIAKALDRPPSYPTKYFGCELGAQVTMNNDYVVNGSHDIDKLIQLLYGFISKFVLCPKCRNPETTLTIVNQMIRQKCIACGHDNFIPKNIHKLTTFIINHPPDGSHPIKAKSEKKEKGHKSKKHEKHDKNGGGSPSSQQQQDSGNDATPVNPGDEDDEFDEEDLTTDAYIERMKQLEVSDEKENGNLFFNSLKTKKEAGLLGDLQVQKDLVREADDLKIKDKATLILSEVLFGENFIEEIKTHRILLLRFCHENKKAQRYLLGGFEKLVGDVYKEKLFDSIPFILKQLYDEDVVDEETIIEWAAKESKKYVSKEMSKKIHEKAAPFVKWLKEAEIDDDSDEDEDSNDSSSKNDANEDEHEEEEEEDDDDGIDLEFSHRVSGITIETKTAGTIKAVNADVIKEEAGGDDIDIDNI